MLMKSFITAFCVLCAFATTSVFAAADYRVADAAMKGDLGTLRSLLVQKSDVNAAQPDGMTALHWATHKNDVEMVRVLLRAGADVKRGTRIESITPLLMASESGNAPILELLLAAGADPNQTNELGTTPLMMAAASGSLETVQTLLDHKANVNAKEKARNQTALMFAAAFDRSAVVRLLASRGADVNAVSRIIPISNDLVDEDGNPIPAPSRTGQTGRRPRGEGNVTGIGGLSALHYAAREGFMNTVRTLVEAGATVDRINPMDKTTPMLIATINGQYDVAGYLLEKGANPNATAIDGMTPLYAVLDTKWAPVAWTPTASTADSGIVQQKTSYFELMKALLDRGANPNAKVIQTPWYNPPHHAQRWVQWAGTTPFWRAANATDLEAMKLLASFGADGKLASDENTTSLMAATGVGWTGNFSVNAPDSFLAATKYLVEVVGVDVNVQNTTGYTAIMGAAWRGDNEVVRYLAQKGARLDFRTELGWSATDMANGPYLRSSFPVKHPDTISLLVELGAPKPIQVDDEEILGVIKRKIDPVTGKPVAPEPKKKP
jgi:ankyrin repeat protein